MKNDIQVGRLILAAIDLLESATMNPMNRKFQIDPDVYEELRIALDPFRSAEDE